MAVSELADWWDGERRVSEEALEEWVLENPQWWAVGLATAAATSMELGAGMVDALRFGEGAAEGGWKGYGKDALRLLMLAGPLGRAGGQVSRLLHMGKLRVAARVGGVSGPCTFQAANNATSIVAGKGKSFFLTIREMASALGRPLSSIGREGGRYNISAWIDDLVPFLRNQGVKIRQLAAPNTLDDVVRAAKSNDGVVVFAMKWSDEAGNLNYHSMIAMKDIAGRVRFADYGGKFMRSLDELASRGGIWRSTSGYQVHSSAGKSGAAVVEGLRLTGLLENAMVIMKGGMLLISGVTAIEMSAGEGGAQLAVPVQTAAAPTDPVDVEVIKESFEAFKERKKGKPRARLRRRRPRRRGGVPPTAYLTGVQYRLNAAGFGAGPIDGIHGPKTKRATRRFQKAYGLRVDAIPGPRTQAKLVEVCCY